VNYFAGTIDEVAIYNTDLSAATIAAHYASTTAAETWTTTENHDYKFQVTVDNDTAGYGLSSTATFTSQATSQ
jgi:hypothetical protein